jgi:hypothetical protein
MILRLTLVSQVGPVERRPHPYHRRHAARNRKSTRHGTWRWCECGVLFPSLCVRPSADHPSKSVFRWTWSSRHPVLHWTLDANVSTVRPSLFYIRATHIPKCYRVPDAQRTGIWTPQPSRDTPLAVFTGRALRARVDRRPHPHATLMAHPAAYEGTLLDHVVLGAFMLERRRLTSPPSPPEIPGVLAFGSGSWRAASLTKSRSCLICGSAQHLKDTCPKR